MLYATCLIAVIAQRKAELDRQDAEEAAIDAMEVRTLMSIAEKT